MCRSCGAIVGAGQLQCAVCGTPTSSQSASSPQHRPPDRETLRFARAVLDRPYKFTIVFLIANFFIFLLMWESSGMDSQTMWQGFPEPVLALYGAKLNYLINAPHYQWWRFVTPMFIHVNLPHVLVNMYSLWMVGPYVEKLYGSAKFVVFWVLTGIAGVVASYLTVRPSLAGSSLGRFIFKTNDVPSAGASGALFGLVGVLFVFGIKFRHELPEGFKRAFGTGMIPIILINLVIGFLGRGFIDNAAHLGGLLAGAALALAVEYRRPGERGSIATIWKVLQAVSLIVVVLSFYKIVRNFNRQVPMSAQQIAKARSQVRLNFVNAMNLLQEQVARVIHNKDASEVETVSQRALQAPPPDSRAAELRDRLLVILSNMATATIDRKPIDQSLMNDYYAWENEYAEWLKGATNGD
ncbi:MAG TPA: rhomboid family intramembrane serine protease [Pyrinomonadaceae bacterium]|nr:rhomboid family intramembrane serine protease [Pyrinomonadaceae bacterium]